MIYFFIDLSSVNLSFSNMLFNLSIHNFVWLFENYLVFLCLSLMSNFSAIKVVRADWFLLPYTWNSFFFFTVTIKWCLCLKLRCVSLREQKVGFIFFQSIHLICIFWLWSWCHSYLNILPGQCTDCCHSLLFFSLLCFLFVFLVVLCFCHQSLCFLSTIKE